MNRLFRPSAIGFLLFTSLFASPSRAHQRLPQRIAFLQAAGTSANALLRSLSAELASKNLASAEKIAQDFLNAAGGHPDARLALGVAFAQHGYFRQAASQFATARRQAPRNYSVSYNLALALFRSDQYEEAAQVLSETSEYRNTAELHHLLADVYEESGRHVDALQEYQKAIELEPDNEAYWFALGYELLKHQTYDGAAVTLEPAVQRFPKSFELRLALGITYFARRQYDPAAESFVAATELSPNSLGAYRMLAAACTNRARWGDPIVAKFRHFMALQPKTPWGPYLYALAREESSGARTAREQGEIANLYRASISLDPQLAEPRYRLGRVYAKQNKLGEAVEQLEAAVRAKPGWPEPHYQLALAYLKSRKKDAAQREFQIHRKLQNDQEQERAERIRDVKQFILMIE